MKNRENFGKTTVVSLTLLALGVMTACTTVPQENSDGSVNAMNQPGAQNVATVLKVNKDLGYVILETTVAPAVGQEAEIKRSGKVVGVVRITDDQSMPFVAADVVSGNVFVGDAVLLIPAVGEK